MADTLVSHFLTTTSTSAFEAIEAGDWVSTVLSVTICNNAGSSTNFNMYIDPNGSATGDAGGTNTYLYAQQTIPSEATFEHTDKIILHASDKLYIQFTNTNSMGTTVTSLKQTS